MIIWAVETRASLPHAKEKLSVTALLHKSCNPSSLMPHGGLNQDADEKKEKEKELELDSQISPPTQFPLMPLASSHVTPKVVYSLSSGASSTLARSRTRSRPISPESSSSLSASSLRAISSSLRADDHDGTQRAHFELPPIDLFDYLKTLLSQLAASISAIKTAYAHQQAALNPYNMQGAQGRETDGGDVSAADKAMVEELERLSHLHVQLSLVRHMSNLKQEQCRCGKGVAEVQEDHGAAVKKELLKKYEGIITSFHDEIRRKDAVTAALKETLAKSLLGGEKLERRVKALEAHMRAHL